jgi:mRNA-degrading endonuclease RelE of RelBE toxin-antitoxin system
MGSRRRFEIKIREQARTEILALRPFDAVRVLDAIKRHLATAPGVPSAKRKRITHEGRTVWQLRVGDLRVFYVFDQETRSVRVFAVREKGRATTAEILSLEHLEDEE